MSFVLDPWQGGDQQKKVGVLSGGERNRVQLAKIVKSGANVLLLDEVSRRQLHAEKKNIDRIFTCHKIPHARISLLTPTCIVASLSLSL